jgi:hypothetical protein
VVADDLDEVPILADDLHEADVVDLDDIEDAPVAAPPLSKPGSRRTRMLLAAMAIVFALGAIGSALWIVRGRSVEAVPPPSAVVVPHTVKPKPAPVMQPEPAPAIAPVEKPPAIKPPAVVKPPAAKPGKAVKKPINKKWDPNSLFIE